MTHRPQSSAAAGSITATHRLGLLGAATVMVAALALSGCNTAAGAGKDVTATGAAVTRGADEVKKGL